MNVGNVLLENALASNELEPAANTLRVALVCMPFCAADRPSIQIGLLTAIARQAGFVADSFHLNLELAARIPDAYDGLSSHRGRMTGEWLFSVAAFGQEAHMDDEAFFAAFPEELAWAQKGGKDRSYLLALRHEVLPRYIDDCLTLVDWANYDVIGFTSTFQQNVASLALAKRIKENYPKAKIIFGGANMEDEMGPEYARAFSFIDYVVVGEGDIVFPELLNAIASNQPLSNFLGLVYKTDEGIQFCGQAQPTRNMDLLPTPYYDEYFDRANRLALLPNPQNARMLPFESSRGCWWGAKHHCTFCGLNGMGMSYRVKNPERVLAELAELTRKHRISFFEATDNILDMKYVKSFFTIIQETKTDFQFFYEVKANLTPEQIRMLYHGGVRWIQPGIESLSTHVLQLMRKGTSMLQNVRLLKWCRYYKIRVSWNLIYGFPGETEEDYSDELDILKLISHLEPPHWCGRIWLERFSPNFFDQDTFPVKNIQPEPSYSFVYPKHVALDKVAYMFSYTMDKTLPDEAHAKTEAWLQEWKQRWDSSLRDTLFYRRTPDTLFIEDNRRSEQRGTHVFYGPMALIYEFCNETMRTVRQVAEHLLASPDKYQFPDEEIQAAMEEFCGRGLMISEDGKYLSLALPLNPNW